MRAAFHTLSSCLLVAREIVRECVESNRAGHTGVRCANVVARLLASPTYVRAEATVLVMGSVPFALLGTGEACRGAGLDDCPITGRRYALCRVTTWAVASHTTAQSNER